MGTYLIGNVKGPKGEDGVSPSAKVQQLSNGAIITITDADGTTSARIRDGVDADGHNIDLTIYPTKVEVNGQIAGLANTYATKTELTNRINAIDIPVSSVNGMTGAVVIPETDLTGYATQSWINQQGFITQVPVASVNGKTGNVSLSAYDVGALPDNTEIPTDTSDLTNNANFVDQSTLNTYLAAKQDALRAGAGIDITNNVVSAKQKLIVADATNFTVEEIGKFDNQTPTNEIYDRATKTIYYFAGREDLVVGEKIYYSPLLDFVSNGVSKDIDVYYIQLSGSGGFTTSGLVAANAAGGGFSGNYNDLTNKPDLSVYAETADLATVATSGDYDDLTDKPDLSVYATTTALGTSLARKQDTLTAGTNITIDANNVISAAAAEDELPAIASGDAGKVLTVNTTEDGVEWTTPSGGATYTAGDGIDIDDDTEIRNTNPFNLSGVYATLFQSGSSTPNWGEVPTGRTTIEDIANDLLKTGISMVDGYSLFSGVSPAAINAVNNTNWAFKIWTRDNTYTWSSRYEASTSTSNLAQYRKNGVFIKTKYNEVAFFESLSVARNALMDNISNGIWVKAGTNFNSVRLPAAIAALDTAISNKQDALPAITNNQSKVLAVNSNATGLEWVEQSGGGSYTAGTGIDITNDEISIDDTVVALKSDIPEDELPDYSNASAGDVLAVDNNGGLEWTTPSGGGGSSGSGDLVKIYRVRSFNTSFWPSSTEAQEIKSIINDYMAGTITKIPVITIIGYDYYNAIWHFVGCNTSTSSTSEFYFYSFELNQWITIKRFASGSWSSNFTITNNYFAINDYMPWTASNRAVSQIYLKDTNNVAYKITVDTTGNLVATAV